MAAAVAPTAGRSRRTARGQGPDGRGEQAMGSTAPRPGEAARHQHRHLPVRHAVRGSGAGARQPPDGEAGRRPVRACVDRADVRGRVRQGRPRGPVARPDPRDAAADPGAVHGASHRSTVDEIDRAAVLSVLGPIYRDKPATGKLLRGWIQRDFGWIAPFRLVSERRRDAGKLSLLVWPSFAIRRLIGAKAAGLPSGVSSTGAGGWAERAFRPRGAAQVRGRSLDRAGGRRVDHTASCPRAGSMSACVISCRRIQDVAPGRSQHKADRELDLLHRRSARGPALMSRSPA